MKRKKRKSERKKREIRFIHSLPLNSICPLAGWLACQEQEQLSENKSHNYFKQPTGGSPPERWHDWQRLVVVGHKVQSTKPLINRVARKPTIIIFATLFPSNRDRFTTTHKSCDKAHWVVEPSRGNLPCLSGLIYKTTRLAFDVFLAGQHKFCLLRASQLVCLAVFCLGLGLELMYY